MSDKSQIVLVKQNFKREYSYLDQQDVERIYNMALSDYVMLRYPSGNKRPNVDNIEFDFYNAQWIYKRMVDILGRAGGISLTSYKENSLSLNYGGSYIDPELRAEIMPKASVPR